MPLANGDERKIKPYPSVLLTRRQFLPGSEAAGHGDLCAAPGVLRGGGGGGGERGAAAAGGGGGGGQRGLRGPDPALLRRHQQPGRAPRAHAHRGRSDTVV